MKVNLDFQKSPEPDRKSNLCYLVLLEICIYLMLKKIVVLDLDSQQNIPKY